MEAINTPGVIPNVETAWETFVISKCSEALNAALHAYDVIMKSRLCGQLPCDSEEIRKSHEDALEQGIAQLQAETVGISVVTIEKYFRELTVRIFIQCLLKCYYAVYLTYDLVSFFWQFVPFSVGNILQ